MNEKELLDRLAINENGKKLFPHSSWQHLKADILESPNPDRKNFVKDLEFIASFAVAEHKREMEKLLDRNYIEGMNSLLGLLTCGKHYYFGEIRVSYKEYKEINKAINSYLNYLQKEKARFPLRGFRSGNLKGEEGKE